LLKGVPHAQNIILEKRQAAETMKESSGKNLKFFCVEGKPE
jgi:hypothetical protein